MHRLRDWTEIDLPANVRIGLLGVLGLLVVAQAVLVLLRLRSGRDYTELRLRLRTWWWIIAVFSGVIALDKTVSLTLLGFVSFLAFKEFLTLVPTRRADHTALLIAYLSIPIQYVWAGKAWYGMFIIFIPVYIFLALPLVMVLHGETKDFLRAVCTLHWGLMTTVFALSHLAFLIVLPEDRNPQGGTVGSLFFVVVLTQLNDVAQYLWGKSLGRIKIVPTVSPGKTWAGFLGGVGTTTLLAWLAAPYLTPFTEVEALGAGVLISAGGFFGDVAESAIKRDVGVKDSGDLLPGHGGILDRLDSLTYTSPLFFHYLYYLHY